MFSVMKNLVNIQHQTNPIVTIKGEKFLILVQWSCDVGYIDKLSRYMQYF